MNCEPRFFQPLESRNLFARIITAVIREKRERYETEDVNHVGKQSWAAFTMQMFVDKHLSLSFPRFYYPLFEYLTRSISLHDHRLFDTRQKIFIIYSN